MSHGLVGTGPGAFRRVVGMTAGTQFNPRFEAFGFHPEEIVARRPDLTPGQKFLYDRLVRWSRSANGERNNERAGEVWRSKENIAQELGKSAKQIGRDLAKLEAVDLVGHRFRDGRKSNTYFFLFHRSFESATPDSKIERTPVSIQNVSPSEFERTSESCKSGGAESKHSNLNGHPRPVTSILNGHRSPSNQKVLNQQSHTQQDSERFVESAKPSAQTSASANFDVKVDRNLTTSSRDAFPAAGWRSQEDFVTWWNQLVRRHPNKNNNAAARALAIQLISHGTLRRAEFDGGYTALARSQTGRWAEQNGRFAPNLHKLLEDRLWEHVQNSGERMPVRPNFSPYEAAEDYLVRCGIQ